MEFNPENYNNDNDFENDFENDQDQVENIISQSKSIIKKSGIEKIISVIPTRYPNIKSQAKYKNIGIQTTYLPDISVI